MIKYWHTETFVVQQCFLGGRPGHRFRRPREEPVAREAPQKGGNRIERSVHCVALVQSFLYIGAQIISTSDLTMIFLLALISSGLASPIEYEAKSPELRALLESGGPADIGGSWTPNLTPEVKVSKINLH